MSQGGGFYANTGNSPYSQSGSPGGMDASRRSELSHSIRPMSIAQLYKATQQHADAEWTLSSHEIGQITVVAQVLTITKQTTNCVYVINDGSGTIEARSWNGQSSEEDVGKWGEIKENEYIRVTGNLKSFGNKKYINATSIRITENVHELYFHLLETITASLAQFHGYPGSQPGSTSSGINNKSSAYAAQSSGGGADDMAEYATLPPLQRQIISTILSRPEQDAGGVDVEVIAKAIGGTQETAADISAALEALMDAGHIFTTSDESHFQVSR